MYGKFNKVTYQKALTILKDKECKLNLCRNCPGKLIRTYCSTSATSKMELMEISRNYVSWVVSIKWLKRLKKKK